MARTLDWEMDDLGETQYCAVAQVAQAQRKVLGRSEIAALRRQLEHIRTPATRRVSPAANKQLQTARTSRTSTAIR